MWRLQRLRNRASVNSPVDQPLDNQLGSRWRRQKNINPDNIIKNYHTAVRPMLSFWPIGPQHLTAETLYAGRGDEAFQASLWIVQALRRLRQSVR
jgi:hypothetical protein